MPRARVTSKGQVTIPVEVRKALGVGQGDTIAFETQADYVVVRRVPTASEVAARFDAEGAWRLPDGMTKDEAIGEYFDHWVDDSGTTPYVVTARRGKSR